jgi:ubiquitin carboxyl-terminal hydrolase 5/13
MDVLRDHASLARTAGHFDTVYKSECMLCFRSPEQADGLYVNLSSFQGLCQQHLDFDAKRGACPLYLCIKHTREPIKDVDENEPKAAPSSEKLVLDFAAKPKESVEEHVELAVRHSDGAVRTLPLDDPSIPTLVSDSVASIQAHDSAETKAQTELWEEERRVSKYAQDLPQLPAERKIAMDPEQWRCDFTGATDNLWLNLSTGKIGSGRQQPDGSGGNGAALRHYFDTGKQYPLAVKLGTITPTSADVYSYASDEDDMVGQCCKYVII